VHRVIEAVQTFWAQIEEIRFGLLGVAMACQVMKLACTSRAWRNVLVAAYPEQRVRWRSIFAAYLAGVGVNAVFPARAGDLVRLSIGHRAIPGSSYATLVSSMLVLSIADFLLALALFGWALTQDVLPGIDVLPSLPGFDFHWAFAHLGVSEPLLVVAVFTAIAAAVWLRERSGALRDRLAQGFAILRTPGRYARTVLAWQLADWGLRLATIWFALAAFGIHQSVRNVLLVQVTSSLATLIPISPGGIGTEQAFLLYALAGQASRSGLLAFSVGLKLILTAVNVVIGFTAIVLTLRTFRFRRATGDTEPPR
jgi:uncharacterized membrane protein YbhN (UPF0104 family)